MGERSTGCEPTGRWRSTRGGFAATVQAVGGTDRPPGAGDPDAEVWTGDNHTGLAWSNREPTPTERANCRPHLRTEIDRVEPEVVIPTGKHATTSVLAFEDRRVESFLDLVCEPVDCPTLGLTALPILHPS